MFLGIHKLLEIDHRVEVTHNEKFVLAAGHIHVNFVHRNILGVTSIGILLHFWVILLHVFSTDVEGERSSLLNMIQEVPCSRLVSVIFLSEARYFSGLKHVVELVIIRVLAALVIGHLEHAREGTVSV